MGKLTFLIGLLIIWGITYFFYKTMGFEVTALWVLVNIYWELVETNTKKDKDDKKTN